MSRPVLWLTGPPGSGKTSAGREAARRIGLGYRSAGELFRAEAAQRGLDLLAFSAYAEAHPEIDRALDERLMVEAGPGVVLEGRVVGALLRRAGRPVYAVLVTALEPVRAHRIVGRDGGDEASALAGIRRRAASERQRYLSQYGIDLEAEPMDAILDSSHLDRSASADRLEEIFRGAAAGP